MIKSKEEEFKEHVAQILRDNITFAGQVGDYVIHGALDKIWQLHSQFPSQGLQNRVDEWLIACFGEAIARDKTERNHRFLEEALELVQSLGCSRSEAHQLVDYVFERSIGEPLQETGGVMVTLAALCLANGLDMNDAGEIELKRIWTKVEKIREKQANKPKHSPLPQSAPSQGLREEEFSIIRISGVATGVGFKEKLKDGSGFYSENICETLYDTGNDKEDAEQSEKWATIICNALNQTWLTGIDR
jgi:hypothetical protein